MPTDPLSTTFAALADPTRRAILARLVSGECSVTELAKPFEMSMPAVSKHLRVLERAGLIARRREAQWRHCRITCIKLSWQTVGGSVLKHWKNGAGLGKGRSLSGLADGSFIALPISKHMKTGMLVVSSHERHRSSIS